MTSSLTARTYENDIAVLKVDGKFECKSRVLYPACLPSTDSGSYDSGVVATVTGWGTLREGGPVSTSLQKARVPLVGDEECSRVMGSQSGTPDIKETMLCAGDTKGGLDSCQGQSGTLQCSQIQSNIADADASSLMP